MASSLRQEQWLVSSRPHRADIRLQAGCRSGLLRGPGGYARDQPACGQPSSTSAAAKQPLQTPASLPRSQRTESARRHRAPPAHQVGEPFSLGKNHEHESKGPAAPSSGCIVYSGYDSDSQPGIGWNRADLLLPWPFAVVAACFQKKARHCSVPRTVKRQMPDCGCHAGCA